MSHLVADANTPAHVHLDPHGGALAGGDDNYEDYMVEYNDDYPGYYNYEQWNAGDVTGSIPTYSSLYSLFYDLAEITDNYDSDNVDGEFSGADDINTGEVEYATCKIYGDALMPLVFKYTAALFNMFISEVKPTITISAPSSAFEEVTIKAFPDGAGVMGISYVDFQYSMDNLTWVDLFTDTSPSLGWSATQDISSLSSGETVYYRSRSCDNGSLFSDWDYTSITKASEEPIAVEFVWQEVQTVSDVSGTPVYTEYVVKVKAGEVPPDPSTFVYPYLGDNPMYDAVSITVEDSTGNEVTDEDTLRLVLSLARNAALYRQMDLISGDQVPTLSLTGGFTEVATTDPASFFFGLIDIGGGTDTSFGYDYPGSLIFPIQYAEGDGDARLVDWTLVHSGIALLDPSGTDYLHPAGIADEGQRQVIYTELLQHMLLQDGVDRIVDQAANAIYSLVKDGKKSRRMAA